jgi:hypothetical protein
MDVAYLHPNSQQGAASILLNQTSSPHSESLKGLPRSPEDNCGYRKTAVDNQAALPVYSVSCLVAFLLDRGAYRSLTIDTMCQNPFVPFALFEREWFE